MTRVSLGFVSLIWTNKSWLVWKMEDGLDQLKSARAGLLAEYSRCIDTSNNFGSSLLAIREPTRDSRTGCFQQSTPANSVKRVT